MGCWAKRGEDLLRKMLVAVGEGARISRRGGGVVGDVEGDETPRMMVLEVGSSSEVMRISCHPSADF